MAHINQDQTVRARLIAHRNHVQHMIDRLDAEIGCGDLLAEVVTGYETLGALCADLAVEHLREHVTEVDDNAARAQGAHELEKLLRVAFK